MVFSISCADGWFNLLDCLFEALSCLGDANTGGIRIEGVRSKYGSLRIDWTGQSQSAEALIQLAEALSERTCEVCGAPGSEIEKAGWLTTLCLAHGAEGSH